MRAGKHPTLSRHQRNTLEAHAARMRSAPTSTEQLLWRRINRMQLGVEFRRQVCLGRFIVDFLAPAHRLIVEGDGSYHAGRRRADERRDGALRRMGYRVLRLEAALVLGDIAQAVEQVRSALNR